MTDQSAWYISLRYYVEIYMPKKSSKDVTNTILN